VRILGEVKREYADLLRRADAIFIDELRATRDEAGLLVRQDGAGVRGVPAGPLGRRDGRRPHLRARGRAARGRDDRLHDRPLGAPAARAARRVSNRIINEVRGINRVVYDISSKPPATIEWE
jgi:GMP synthase (glutamine-hydrolysing)